MGWIAGQVTVTSDLWPQKSNHNHSGCLCQFKEIPSRCSCDIVFVMMRQTDNLEAFCLQPRLSPMWGHKNASKHLAAAKISHWLIPNTSQKIFSKVQNPLLFSQWFLLLILVLTGFQPQWGFTFDVSVSRHAVTEQLHVSLNRLHPGVHCGVKYLSSQGLFTPRTPGQSSLLPEKKHKQAVGKYIRVWSALMRNSHFTKPLKSEFRNTVTLSVMFPVKFLLWVLRRGNAGNVRSSVSDGDVYIHDIRAFFPVSVKCDLQCVFPQKKSRYKFHMLLWPRITRPLGERAANKNTKYGLKGQFTQKRQSMSCFCFVWLRFWDFNNTKSINNSLLCCCVKDYSYKSWTICQVVIIFSHFSFIFYID